ncbi:MAG: hypothetical protein O7D86_12145 [Proteobacteria bacterium]|nr:hypothetical protein [Pseudomonadota bacterium]
MKAMVGLVIVILIIFSVTLFWPSSQPDVSNVSLNENANEQEVMSGVSPGQDKSSSMDLNAPSDDEKIKLMTAEYEILKKTRKKLKSRLARLKHDMWGLKFFPEKAKEMNGILMNAHKLIKNPDMLGAFSNVKGIQDEIAKVNFAKKSLEQVNAMIKENNKSSKDSG